MLPEQSYRLAPLAQDLFEIAAMEAINLAHDFIGTEHLFLALTRVKGGVTAHLLAHLKHDPHDMRSAIRARAWSGAHHPGNQHILSPTPRLKVALDHAQELAGDAPLGERALLRGILMAGPGVVVRTIAAFGTPIDAILEVVASYAGPEATEVRAKSERPPIMPIAPFAPFAPLSPLAPGGSTPTLDRYGRDLIAAAQAGKLRATQLRKREQGEIARALARTERNVPVLVGEAGVGKTAIVHGLAVRMAEAIDHPEERPIVPILQGKRIIELRVGELVAGTRHRGDFEERIVGIIEECRAHPEIVLFIDEIHLLVGAGSASGAPDAAQMLKPVLSGGEMRIIGATTPAEYDRFIAADPALERRMQRILVAEPTPDETKTLLRALHADLEARTQVSIEVAALDAAVDLTMRYQPERYQPAKALDLIDATCATVQVPDEGVSMMMGPGAGAAPEHVTVAVVTKELARELRLPIGALEETESERLLRLKRILSDEIIGQDEALEAVERQLQISSVLAAGRDRPRAVMLFAGPTGVGKTETARAIARALFPGAVEQTFLQIDMGEFSQEHTLAQLIGAPPGYVGYDREGRLTGWLNHHPFSVVLFDEIEKAHPATLDLLLGLFDTGRITDGRGRTCVGREAIYVLTSNLLIDPAASTPGFTAPLRGAPTQLERDHRLRQELGKILRPELVNRFDIIVRFNALSPTTLHQIAYNRIMALGNQIFHQAVTLDLDEALLDWFVSHTDTANGARALDRTIAMTLQGQLAQLQLEGALAPGATIRIVIVNDIPAVIPPQQH